MNTPEPAGPPAMPAHLRKYIAGRLARDLEAALASGEDVSDLKSDIWEALAKALDGPAGFMQQYVQDRMEAGIEQSAAIAEFEEHTPSEQDMRQAMRAFADTEAGGEAFRLHQERDLRAAIGLENLTNEELVRRMHDDALAKRFLSFEYRLFWNGTAVSPTGGHTVRFEAKFVDLARFEVYCTMSEARMRRYPRGNTVVSMLFGRTFAGVEAFAVACHNALGDDVASVPLCGRVLVDLVEDEE